MTKRHAISKVDTAWLRMESPTNLMMITGVMGLSEAVDFDRLVDTIALRFLSFPRFRHKAVTTSRGSFWEFDEDFDILAHVRRTALPGKADQQELQELVSELASTPLDKSKPLWQFHLVENFVEGPVIISRIHHCYADGIALIQVMLSLTDPGPEPRASASSPARWKNRRVQESNIFKRFVEPAKQGMDGAIHFGQKLFEEAVSIIKDPEQLSGYAHEATEITEELANALLLSDDPETRFRGRLGVRKRVAWTPPLPLKEVKAVGQAFKCTVNDVLIASATGALNSYLRACGEDTSDLEIRATVPVNLRPLEHARDLGNHFGLVFLDLPVGEDNPLHRLMLVHQHMQELKQSRQAAVSFGLLAALGMGPSHLQKPMLEMMSRKATTVLTNVPGPRSSLFIAGAEIGEMMFWVPQNGSIGMGISILSYNDNVYMGLMTDRRLVPDPQAITESFQHEFEKLLYLALQMPEGEVVPDDIDDWLGNLLTASKDAGDVDVTGADSNVLPINEQARRSMAPPATESLKTATKKKRTKKTGKKSAVRKAPGGKKVSKKANKKAASKKTVGKKTGKKASKKTPGRQTATKSTRPVVKKTAKKTTRQSAKKITKKAARKATPEQSTLAVTGYQPRWKKAGKKSSKKVLKKR